MAEGFFDQFRKKQQNYGGIDVSVEKEDNNILVKATANGRELGRVLFTPSEQDDNLLVPLDLEVDERYRGQGIGATMYDYVKSLGYTIRRSQYQTDAGAGFWDKHKSGKNVWEQGVAEDESDAIDTVAKRLTDPKDGMTAKLRAAGDKRREDKLKGRNISRRDTTSKDEWGDLKKENMEETARMSAAAKLSKAWDQQQAKSAASRKRGQELLNPPKKEEPKTPQPVSEKFHIFKRFKKTRKY